MTNFYHKREELKAMGMFLISDRPDSDEPAREYWGFKDRQNGMGEHSATLTHAGNGHWIASLFLPETDQ